MSPKPLSPLPPLMEGDVVEYLITHRQRQKGQLPAGDRRVLGLGVVNFIGQIHPLCKRKEDDPLLYYDEEQDVLDGEWKFPAFEKDDFWCVLVLSDTLTDRQSDPLDVRPLNSRSPAHHADPLETIVTRVLERVSYSQRCIENRLINPHGEEAEDVFEIEEALSEGCGPAIRYS